jgi:hypothetical protein
MNRVRAARRGVVVTAIVTLWSTTAYAQTGIIAGAVKDTSGALMPGVTVEAFSPARLFDRQA